MLLKLIEFDRASTIEHGQWSLKAVLKWDARQSDEYCQETKWFWLLLCDTFLETRTIVYHVIILNSVCLIAVHGREYYLPFYF